MRTVYIKDDTLPSARSNTLPTVVHRICIETIPRTEYYDRFALSTVPVQHALHVLAYVVMYRVNLSGLSVSLFNSPCQGINLRKEG